MSTPAERLNPPMKPLAVSIEQAAGMLALGRNAIYNLINAGSIKTLRVGRRVIIPVSALEEYLRSELAKHSA